MANKLKLGIIGISEGNGHPFSWSAIFNGYNPDEMKNCGFPIIPYYLSKQKYPQDFLSELAEVTHVWTQDPELSRQIAKASKIRNVIQHSEDFIGQVDAVLLARDDGQNHLEIALPFIKAGLPVFIDKPFALSIHEADQMLQAQVYEQQIFTCSTLRFAKELLLSDNEKRQLGKIAYVEGSVMKYWETYGMHILEPLVVQLPERGKLLSVIPVVSNGIHIVIIKWENCLANLKITGNLPSEIMLSFYGENANLTKTFEDSFSCFRTSLILFIKQINTREQIIPRSETLELVEILEKGTC
jgi:hypothetical protein